MPYDLRLYDQLLQFPFFQGLSRSELSQMAGNTKFGFMKLPAHKQAITDGQPCVQLSFLVGGKVEMSTASDDGSYRVAEQLSAPLLVQPETLFGLRQRYTCNVTTLSECHFITLSKDEVLRLLDDFLIIRLNYLGMLATLSQRQSHRPWRRCPQSLEERVIRFFIDHCTYPAGAKTFHILMQRLGDELGESRVEISHVLNSMQQRGLLSLRRGRIDIPSLERLLM